MAPALYLSFGGSMYGRYSFWPRHGGWLVADHLLQVIFAVLASVVSLFAQESGDGFSESDRGMLRDVRSIVSGNSTDLGIIKTAVIHTRDTVDQIETDIDSIDSSLEAIATRQSSFNATQQNMFNTLLNWEVNGVPGTEDLPLIQQNTYNAATHLSYIRPDVNDILDNSIQMNGHLLNIDRETTESSDYLASIDQQLRYLISVSTNNSGVGDGAIVALTNALSLISSRPIDLSVVSNILFELAIPYDIFHTSNIADYPSFAAFVDQWGEDVGGSGIQTQRYRDFLSRSSFGLVMALMDSALVNQSKAVPSRNPWLLARKYWFGDTGFSMDPDFKYSIFDAYNTVGLGVLTNQANILIGQGDYVTNSLAIIVSNLVASLSVAEKTKDALYYPEDSETIYETTNHYTVPEWEPTYHTGIAGNTNYYYYFQQADSFTHSLIGNYTSLLGRVIGGINPQHRDWDAKITWSGWPSMQGQYGGWDLDVRLPDTSDVVDFAKYIKFLSRLVCFVLDLCIVLLGATRIHKTVMGGKLPFES